MLAVALRSGARGVHQPPPPRHPAGLFRGVGLKRFAAHVMSDKKGVPTLFRGRADVLCCCVAVGRSDLLSYFHITATLSFRTSGQAHAATTDEEAASASRAPERPQRDAGGGASTSSASGSGAPLAAAAAATAPVVADSRSTKLTVAGWELEGVSIGGQETCIIVPRAKVAFDIGRCPQRAAFQQTLLISHGHLDHVGGLPFHVSTR